MDTNIETVRQKLVDVQEEIRRGAFRSRQVDRYNGWGGAGVIFSRERLAAPARRGKRILSRDEVHNNASCR